MKILGYVVNFIFVLICCVHVGVVVYIFINPPNPEIKVYEKLLKDIEFPVAFILCVDKIKNSSREYQDIGYEDVDTFFAGIGKFNGNMGWNGHRGNGTTIGSPNNGVLTKLHSPKSVGDSPGTNGVRLSYKIDDYIPPSSKSNHDLRQTFSWEDMLKQPEFVAAPVSAFRHAPMSDCWENIIVGMKVS